MRSKSLAEWTTFGIGGDARELIEVKTIGEMQEALASAKEKGLRFFILGKGSNCLFDDVGYDGLVIINKINYMEQRENVFEAGAGYSFSLLGVKTARAGFSGLEFASGIPGSVGGAVVMNAGANGQETADVLSSVQIVDCNGDQKTYSRKELSYSYRSSPFQTMQAAVVSATFTLSPSETARGHQISIIDYRKETQPLKEKSAGCMFRNPEGESAGALIEQCGLKGAVVGDAQISHVHANFIVNGGAATADDVRTLIEQVKERVLARTGILLQQEVIDVSS